MSADHLPQQVDYFGLRIPYMEYLGVVPVSCEQDRAVTRLAIRHDLLNSRGHIHGGALMSVLDFTMSAAGRAHDPLGYGLATIDMNTSFIEPVVTDITIQTHCFRRGTSICFCEGQIVDPNGKILVKATATFKLIRLSPGGD